MASNQPIKQHDLPATYLRRFVIDSSDKELQSILWCLRKDRNFNIEKKSINSSYFTTENFYTIDGEDPFAIEYFFRDNIEPRYEEVMREVKNERNLSIKCRQNLMIWLHYSKIRNKNQRDKLKENIYVSQMLNLVPKIGLKKSNELSSKPPTAIELLAKELQIKSFAEKNLLNIFDKGLGAKHWSILKAKQGQYFISNENPGFSIEINSSAVDFYSLSESFSTSVNASNFFILSPQYCVQIRPHLQGSPITINLGNQTIEFEECYQALYDLINFCTFQIAKKYLISNNLSILENVKIFFDNEKKR